MTREEAIMILRVEYSADVNNNWNEALKVAIKALEQDPCEDAISRQAVLDAMYELCDTGETLKENPWRDNPHIDALVEAIEELPSVTPQHSDVEIQKIQEMEQAEIQKAYELGKAEQPQQRTGRWIITHRNGKNMYVCSECNNEPLLIGESYPIFKLSDYCPNCGAKMEE